MTEDDHYPAKTLVMYVKIPQYSTNGVARAQTAIFKLPHHCHVEDSSEQRLTFVLSSE